MLPSCVKLHLVQSTKEQLYLSNGSKGINGIHLIYQEVKRGGGRGSSIRHCCTLGNGLVIIVTTGIPSFSSPVWSLEMYFSCVQ